MTACPECGSEYDVERGVCSKCAGAVVATATSVQPVEWTVLQQQGPLVLGESAYEYAVYDQDKTYGTWPRTSEGYRMATESFGAYGQSLAHGVAYAATGYQDPSRLGMPTTPVIESRTYAAPLSFVGSTRRIIHWSRGALRRSPHLRVLLWVVTVLALLVSWALVTCWYLVVFGLFGIVMIPYRLIRRSQRKSLHVQQTALATQQAMFQQMSAMMEQNQRRGPAYGSPVIPPEAGPATSSD